MPGSISAKAVMSALAYPTVRVSVDPHVGGRDDLRPGLAISLDPFQHLGADQADCCRIHLAKLLDDIGMLERGSHFAFENFRDRIRKSCRRQQDLKRLNVESGVTRLGDRRHLWGKRCTSRM